MTTTWSHVTYALSVACAVAWPATPARACSGPPWPSVRIASWDSRTEEPARVPLGAGVLLVLDCTDCPVAEASPEVVVRTPSGVEVEGAARWVAGGSKRFGRRYALWEPRSPLEAGDYELSWVAPVAAILPMSDALSFTVTEDEGATEPSALEPELELIAAQIGLSEAFDCPLIDCEGGSPFPIWTRSAQLPTVVADSAREPTVDDHALFLYRARASNADATDAPVWEALDYYLHLSVQFETAQDEYCVELQALRVDVGEVLSLGEHCVPDTLGELEPARPQPFEACDAATSEMEAVYRSAWCEDNAESCALGRLAPGCSDYEAVCGREGGTDAGDDSRGGERSGGCTALPANHRSSGLTWLTLFALAAVCRSRRGRTALMRSLCSSPGRRRPTLASGSAPTGA